MSQRTQAALMLAILIIGLASVKTGRSPLHLAAVALLNVRATLWWINTERQPSAWQLAITTTDEKR